jgi:hypothetical protein
MLEKIVCFRNKGFVILSDSLRQPTNTYVTNEWSPCPKLPECLLLAAPLSICPQLILLFGELFVITLCVTVSYSTNRSRYLTVNVHDSFPTTSRTRHHPSPVISTGHTFHLGLLQLPAHPTKYSC